jgi:hypothetical protein
MIELLQLTVARFSLQGGLWSLLSTLGFGHIGSVVVGLFLAAWALSVLLWKPAASKDFGAGWSNGHRPHAQDHRATPRPQTRRNSRIAYRLGLAMGMLVVALTLLTLGYSARSRRPRRPNRDQ